MNKIEKRKKELRYLKRQEDKLKNEGTNKAINILQVLPMYVLAKEYGFGNKRLWKFLMQMYRYTAQAQKDEHVIELMQNELEHDKGIRIDIIGGEVENLREV